MGWNGLQNGWGALTSAIVGGGAVPTILLAMHLYDPLSPTRGQKAGHQKYFQANENSEVSDSHRDRSRVFRRNGPVPPG